MPRNDNGARIPRFVLLASMVVVVAALYFAQDVLIPLALSLLVSFLLAPLVSRLENWWLGRIPSVMLVVTLASAFLLVLGYIVYLQITQLAADLPSYRDNITQKVQAITQSAPGPFGRAAETIQDVQKELAEPETANGLPGVTPERPLWTIAMPPPRTPLQLLRDNAAYLLGPLGTAGLVVVFTFFMLISREDLRDRLIRLIGQGRLEVTTTALDDAAGRISRYLMAQAIINGTYGIAIGFGLWLIGQTVTGEPFPNFVLWALLCALLRFIPYVGPWIGAILPLAVAFAVFPGYGVFIATAAMFIIVELFSNNLMEPWLYGTSTGMSTMAVLVSAVFWTFLWGPIGLLLATPMTVCLVVLGKYVPQLKFLDIILGDEPVLEPHERVYQRLLAGDLEEATELAHEFAEEMPLEELYDGVLLPALAMAESDRHRRRLEDARQTFIRQSMQYIVEELGDRERLALAKASEKAEERSSDKKATSAPGGDGAEPRPPRPQLPEGCQINVVCLPAHDEADEIIGSMLAQLLEFRGYCAVSVPVGELISEMMEEVDRRAANVVCVSAMPPAAVAHARYLCKRIHGRHPEMEMVVGLWTFGGNLDKARERIACMGKVQVITTLTAALDRINQSVQPLIAKSRKPEQPQRAPTPEQLAERRG